MSTLDETMDQVNMPQDLRAIAKAIYKQESSSGQADTSKANYANAIGPMQVTKPTFDNLKKQGWIPEDYQFDNPEHTTVAGLSNIVALANQFGGDPRKVAAAYYAGPKAVAPDGTIKPLQDKKNPNAPNAVQYADKVAKNAGASNALDDNSSKFIKAANSVMNSQDAASQSADNSGDVLQQMQQTLDQNPIQTRTQQQTTPAPGAPAQPAPAVQGGGTGIPQPAGSPTGGPERSLGQRVGRIGAEVGGGVLGAMAGAATPVPGGALVGGALGTAAGSELASHTFDPLPEGEAGKEALYAGGFSLAGGALGKVISGLIRPKGLIEGGKELTEILAQKGIVPTPAQAFTGTGIQNLENIGGAAFYGSGSLKAARDAATTGVRETAQEWAAKWAGREGDGARLLGQVAQQADEKGVQIPTDAVKNAAEAMKNMFTNVDSPARKVAEDILATTTRNPTMPFSVSADTAIARQAAATAQQQATGIAATPQLQGAQQLRTKLMDIVRTSNNKNEVQMAQKTMSILDDQISQTLSQTDPAMHTAWRMGNSLYKAGMQGKEIADIMSRALINGGEGDVGEIGGKQLLNQLKDHRVSSQLTDDQISRMAEFGRALKAAEGTGDRAFSFTTRGLQIQSTIQIAGAVGAGVNMQQGGDNKVTAGALALALGPIGLAKIFASPKTFNLMMSAMNTKAGTVQAGQIGTRLALQMIQEGIITAPAVKLGQGGTPDPSPVAPQ